MYGLPEGIIIVFVILAIVYAIILFLLPIYVFNIRNLLLKQNKLLEQIISNTARARPTNTGSDRKAAVDKYFDNIKICSHCGAKNKKQDYTCRSCSKTI